MRGSEVRKISLGDTIIHKITKQKGIVFSISNISGNAYLTLNSKNNLISDYSKKYNWCKMLLIEKIN